MDEFAAVGRVATLLAEPARAKMLGALMGGRMLPAGELAFCANVSAQTASNHLRRLLEGGLVQVASQGRHRYYRLAEEVAAAIEALARGFLVPQDDRSWQLTPCGRDWFADLGLPRALLDAPDPKRPSVTQRLDWTERRYHLAGPIGVAFFHRLLELKWIAGTRQSRATRVTNTGLTGLERRLGVTIPRG